MNRKTIKNYSGIAIFDSITMSVKKRRPDMRRIEAVLIALLGFVSVILSFFNMFSFNYNKKAVIISAIIAALAYTIISLSGKYAYTLAGISLIIFIGTVYYFLDLVKDGFKYVYNIIYCDSKHTVTLFYKNLKPENEIESVTTFFILCIWFIAMVSFIFTIRRPNPIAVIAVTFPIIEIGLYNGIKIPIIWGMLTIAYWFAVMAMYNIDTGEYFGGSGGFVRKENVFFPKRQMKLKVTEKCAFIVIICVTSITLITLSVMKITNYERSESLKQKRIAIKEAANSFTIDDISSGISSITEAFGFSFAYDTHKLGNLSHVTYKNVTDMTVTFDKSYDGAVYLKGYAGSVYGDNEWTELNDSLYNNSLFTEFMANSIYPQDFPHYFSRNALSDESDITIWINAERKKDKSVAPYGTNNFGDMKYDHDLTVSSKKKGQDEYSYKFIGIDANTVEYYMGTVTDENPLEKEYRDFVYDNYLQIPDDSKIDEVRNAYADIIDAASDNMTASEKLTVLGSLRDRINSSTNYTLSPGETPSNRDFVNYFLLENHKGYCSHYATAGVLLSRMAGIPARYATGYVIVSDDFNENSMNPDGSYTINVMDNRSHAWAEIYLDGFGWIPFEFTKGYSANSIINAEETTTQQTEAVQTATSANNNASENTSVISSAKKSSASSKISSSSITETSAAIKTTTIEKDNDSLQLSGEMKKILTVFGIILFISAVIYIRRLIILKLRKKHLTTGSYADRTAYMYKYAKNLLSQLHIEQKDMQYIQFAEFVEYKLVPFYFEKGEFIKFMNTVLEGNFGGNSLTDKKTIEALNFVTDFGDSVYKKAGLFSKIKIRLLTVLK